MKTHADSANPRPVAMQHGRHNDRMLLARLRGRRRWAVLVLAAVLAFPSAAEADTAKVYFTKGEQLRAVQRDIAPGPAAAVTALLAGPTAAERKGGFGTTIPAGTRLTASKVTNGTAELTFSATLADAEVAQVVYTATAAGAERVRLRGRTFTRDDFARPDEYVEPEPPAKKIRAPANARLVQTQLAGLGYLPSDAVTGKFDYRTQQAVLAFQSWEGLARDGVVGPMTLARLKTAGRPVPIDKSAARHVEIYRARGVVLLISGGRAVRAIHTSTGVGGDSPDLGTPPGRFRIYRKEAALLVGAVQVLAAVRRLLGRRLGDARLSRHPRPARLPRVRTAPAAGGQAGLRLRRDRDAGSSHLVERADQARHPLRAGAVRRRRGRDLVEHAHQRDEREDHAEQRGRGRDASCRGPLRRAPLADRHVDERRADAQCDAHHPHQVVGAGRLVDRAAEQRARERADLVAEEHDPEQHPHVARPEHQRDEP